jgi:hypothetical protein
MGVIGLLTGSSLRFPRLTIARASRPSEFTKQHQRAQVNPRPQEQTRPFPVFHRAIHPRPIGLKVAIHPGVRLVFILAYAPGVPCSRPRGHLPCASVTPAPITPQTTLIPIHLSPKPPILPRASAISVVVRTPIQPKTIRALRKSEAPKIRFHPRKSAARNPPPIESNGSSLSSQPENSRPRQPHPSAGAPNNIKCR